MKCVNDKRRKLTLCSVTFICNDCHYVISSISLDDLTSEELNQIKKECDYYIKINKR